MDNIAQAFAVLGYMVNLNGRKLWQAYKRSRYRVIQIEHGSPMLYVKMAPRKLRRMSQGKEFRAVYGRHAPPMKISHEDAILALRTQGLPEINNSRDRNKLKAKRRSRR